MLDSKYLRSELKETAERLATRNYKLDVEKLTKLEEMRKDLMVRTQDLQAKRNSMSKSIGQAKREGKDITEIKNEVAKIGDELDVVKAEQDKVLAQINEIALTVPNLPDASLPVGPDDSANVEIRRVGTPRPFHRRILD